MSAQSFTEFLMDVPIFTDLDKDTLGKIANLGRRRIYEKDSVILLEEDIGSALFVIIRGKVKVSRSSIDGKEVIFAILGASDFFGEMAILDGLTRSATVIATEDSELFIIQRNDFINLLKTYPEVSISLLQELTRRLRTADLKIKALSLKDAEGKVAAVVLQIANDMGKIKQGKVEIEKLPMYRDLANMAGTSRETISRTFRSFIKKGLIEQEGYKLTIVDFEKFKEYFG